MTGLVNELRVRLWWWRFQWQVLTVDAPWNRW